MNVQRELNMLDAFARLFKSGIFIAAVCLYCVYFVTNLISSLLLVRLYDSVVMNLFSLLLLLPSVLTVIGLIIALISGARYDINKLHTAATVLKVGLVMRIVYAVIDAYLSIFAVAEATSGYNYIGNSNAAGISGILGVLISMVINIAFIVLLIKLVNNFLYSAECDIPMPEFGMGTAVCMIVLAFFALLAALALFLDSSFLGIAMLCYGVFYGLMAAFVFLYRSESKKVYYRREYFKHVSDREQAYYR